MNGEATESLERWAYVSLVALLLGPVVAHGLWLPLVHVVGPAGSASSITGSALAISGTMAIARRVVVSRARLLPAFVGGLGAVAATVGLGLGLGGLLTLLSVAGATAFLVSWLPSRLPGALDGLAGRHKGLTVLYALVALAAVVSTARLTIFMGDLRRTDQQVLPGLEFLETHSCLSAYVHAASLAGAHRENLYEDRWWHGADGLPPIPDDEANPFRPFQLDHYLYPPPFLLVMTPLVPFDGDFPAQRALWFGLQGLLLAAGLWVVARWIDGPSAHRPLLLAPLFFGSLPVLATQQVGNFQIGVVVIAVLAMVAFDRERPAVGGALLAFAIVAKLSPALLGIVLLRRRRWPAAAWTAGFGVLYLVLSISTLGPDPMVAFVTYVLPRLSSGEAFAFMDDRPFSIVTNMSPFGLPFKLELLGLEVGDPWVLARRIGHGYTIVLALLALWAGRRVGDRRAQAMTWMALLVLAALQSPFAPGYVAIAFLWALTLLSAEVRGAPAAVGLGILWILVTILPPLPVGPLAAFSVLQMCVAVGVPTWMIVRATGGPAPSVQR